MKEVISILTAGMTASQIIAMVLMALFGLFLSIVIDVVKRKPESNTSPYQLSLRYWWKDNKSRLLLSLLLIPTCIILYQSLSGKPIDIGSAFMIGWCNDTLSDIMKRKGIAISGYNA